MSVCPSPPQVRFSWRALDGEQLKRRGSEVGAAGPAAPIGPSIEDDEDWGSGEAGTASGEGQGSGTVVGEEDEEGDEPPQSLTKSDSEGCVVM